MPRSFVLTVACVMLVFLTGCRFDRQWRQLTRAELAGTSAATDALSGRWEGNWVSEPTKHTGKLRAIITPIDERTYEALFDASYLAILRFGYGMQLHADRKSHGVISFHGEENLGKLAGGLYRYQGTADGATFRCKYVADADHGYFEMTRPQRR